MARYLHKKGTHFGCLFYGAILGLLSLPVAVSMPWFPCRIAGKVADGCKATWTNAQRLPRRGEPPRRSRWGGGESTARRIKRSRRLPHPPPETESESNLVRFLFFIDFQYSRAQVHCTHASPRTALPGAKRLQKTKKPTCLGQALAETEACLPVTA